MTGNTWLDYQWQDLWRFDLPIDILGCQASWEELL
jgi:hypothetical protein